MKLNNDLTKTNKNDYKTKTKMTQTTEIPKLQLNATRFHKSISGNGAKDLL